MNIFADLQKRDITLISLKDNVDATTNSGKFMMNVFAALAEFERSIIIERCQSGRAGAMSSRAIKINLGVIFFE